MTNASTPTTPDRPGDKGSPDSRRSLFAKRRLVFVSIALLAVVAVGALANYGPLTSYLDARSRLERAAAKVAALEGQKAELQSRLGKLTEAEYLESLAREDLTYARPGEDVYIITESTEEAPQDAGSGSAETGAAESGTADGAEDATSGSGSPGPLERLLSALIGIF